MDRSLTIIVPCYNEELYVEQCIADLEEAFKSFPNPWEILVIDDCSRDRTPEKLRNMQAQHPHLRVHRNAQNMGLGGSYHTGIKEARMAHVVFFPADNEMNAASVRHVCDHIGQADVIASYAENPEIRPKSRQLVSRLYTFCVNLISGRRLKYYNGPFVHSKRCLSQVDLKTPSFAYQAEIMVQMIRQGRSVLEVPHRLNYCSERARVFTPKNVFRVSTTLWRLALMARSVQPIHQESH